MKKPVLFYSWLIYVLFVTFPFNIQAQRNPVNDQESPKLKPILSSESKKGWHRFAQGVDMDLQKPERFFEQHSEAFGLQKGYGMKLLGKVDEQDLNMTHHTFQQTFNGTPIVGAVYKLHHRQGRQLKGNGQIVRDFGKNEKPTISGEAALQAVLSQINATRYAWQSPQYEAIIKKQKKDDNATLYPQPELVYYSTGDREDASTYQLAYEMKVFALEPLSHKQYYVSADNGSVIRAIDLIHETNTLATGTTLYNGTQTFNATQALTADVTGNLYLLREANRAGSGTAISTYDMNFGTDYNLAVNYLNSTTTWTTEPVGVQGHWGLEKTFDYYRNVHGRNSFDNNSSEIITYLDYGVNFNNAFWNGLFTTFGGGDGTRFTSWTSLDVVAHEFTHGVTQHTANLEYYYESGALNESFSDIFGNMVRFVVTGENDWLLGRDVTVNKSGIRSMAFPGSFGQPNTYQGQGWFPYLGPFASDNGGVHQNSGVQNYWFYVLAQGVGGLNDLGNSYSVVGIGRDKAAAIAYRNLTVYLTPTSQYIDAREGSLQAAEDLYGTASQAYISTAMAWYAVGIGVPVRSTQDLALRSVSIGGGACNQFSVELYNASTVTTIPAGAVINVTVKEIRSTEQTTLTRQIILPAVLAPGSSRIETFDIVPAGGRITINAAINYTPDTEPRNNTIGAVVLKGAMTIGGAAPDYQSISGALLELIQPGILVCSGDLDFKIRSGQYNEQVIIINTTRIYNAAPGRTITFESSTGNPDDVIIHSTVSTTDYGALTIQNSDGVRIKNLTIVSEISDPTFFSKGIFIAGAVHDLILDGNKVRCPGSNNARRNIVFEPNFLSGSQTQNAIINGVTIRNNILQDALEGIISNNSTGVIDNVLVENNTLTNHKSPINLRGAATVTVRGNTISFSNGFTGISSNASQLLIEKNKLNLSSSSTISPEGLSISSSSTARVINNVININSINSTSTCIAVDIRNTGHSEILHNTINQTVTGGPSSYSFYLLQNTELVVLNNIIANTFTSGGIGFYFESGPGGQNVINYNDLYIPNGFLGKKNNTLYQTLPLWRSGTGYDLNSIIDRPLFVSATDLHLAGQQTNLKIGTATQVLDDIDGNPRNTPPFLGADEPDTPPSVPQGLYAQPGDSQVTLFWTANSESDLIFYNVYGAESGSTPVLIASVKKLFTTFTQDQLTNGTMYDYQISAVDVAGHESAKSAIVSAVPGEIVGRDPSSRVGAVTAVAPNEDEIEEVDIKLFPNPAKSAIHLELPNDDPALIILSDSKGALIKQGNYNQSKIVIDLNNISKGMYVIKVQQGKRVKTMKVVIE